MREIKKLKDALATRGLFYFIERERKREVYAERERREWGEREREREEFFCSRVALAAARVAARSPRDPFPTHGGGAFSVPARSPRPRAAWGGSTGGAAFPDSARVTARRAARASSRARRRGPAERHYLLEL